ncbi:pectinesterase family protein [Opitutus sp. ER46]|uniref:pectinesterase family protein n=1 Tax=Opitutus sp. ER46 TaxID=2161864 RepID=UPI001304CE89|nr:pectinesterase family protein [Opitutus sp. ER46]
MSLLACYRPVLRLAAFVALLAPTLRANAASTWPLSSAFPAPGATHVSPDTPLRLAFPADVQLGQGRIHVRDTATGRDVDVIEVGAPYATQTIGGEPNFRYLPATVTGREVTLHPRNGALQYGASYTVTAEPGAFTVGHQASAALEQGWTFTTRATPPAAGTPRIVVAADGTGDFCTVQGAIDWIPEGNTRPVTLFIRKGTYRELIVIANRHAVTLLGEDRRESVITYANNDRFNPTNGNPFGSPQPQPSAAPLGGAVYHRSVLLAHRVDDLVLANLTVRNATPQGGSQAEAVLLNGTTRARAILKDVDLYSYQDTLQINGQAYLENCLIEGDIDFMWGTGPCFFSRCTARSLRSGAYFTQIRNPGTNHGYVYVGCTFEGAKGIMGNYLTRVSTARFPHSEVVLLDCTLTPAVHPVAWLLQGPQDPAQIHFWEHNSRLPDGQPVDVSARLPGSRQLTEPADAATIANYRNPTWVLGNAWNPRAAPIFTAPAAPAAVNPAAPAIVTPPASQLVLLGTSPELHVLATSPVATPLRYQWNRDGRPIPGATHASLRLPAATWDTAAAYSVTVRNDQHATTSAAAILTPVAPQPAARAPDLPHLAPAVFDVTAFGAVADGIKDNASAIQEAIDTAAAAGGGTVLLPPAVRPYRSAPLTLRSGIRLEIAGGAVLQALPYSASSAPGSYPLTGKRYADFISASKAHDIAISGAGVIDGDGEAWWAAFRADKKMPHRPYLVRLNNCERVLVSGLTLTRSPMFHAAISADHLTVFGVTVDSPEGPNTDGLDPAGTHHLIQNCYVSCGDDNVVMKPGGTFCQDITITDCVFGLGHGMSVGGQSNCGLDGMLVRNCAFQGTVSGLRLKADATQGGEVKNVVYRNLTMDAVRYPIVFYSYYKMVGNPGSPSGSNATTPEKVRAWNTEPPLPLASSTLPSWKAITIEHLTATRAGDFSIIWGLPLANFLIEDVRLQDVRLSGGRGLKLYNATNVRIDAASDVGPVDALNTLAITAEPKSVQVRAGETARFVAHAVGAATYQWMFAGQPLADGPRSDGAVISGARGAQLEVRGVTPANAGKYSVLVAGSLDGFDVAANRPAPGTIPVSAASAPATLTVAPAQP